MDANRAPIQHGDMPKLQLTDDERRLLKECESESFWKRSLPLMIGNAALFYSMRKMRGGNIQFYSVKVGLSTFFAYFVGKITYVSKCREKLEANLPSDSPLLLSMKSASANPMAQFSQKSSDEGNESVFDQLRRENRSAQAPVQHKLDTSMSDQNVTYSESKTYDQLRKQNREINPPQQPQQQAQAKQSDVFSLSAEPNLKAQTVVVAPNDGKRKYRTNKYGDIIYTDE